MKRKFLTIILSAFCAHSFAQDVDTTILKHCYLIVPDSWATIHNGHRSGCNILTVTKDTAGRSLISLNSVNEFPEVFSTCPLVFQFIWLMPSAFPQDKVEEEE